MAESLEAELAAALGSAVRDTRRVHGGDINDSFVARLQDGRRVFVKTHPRPPAGMYGAEAQGLRWLGDSGPLRVPQVLAVRDAQPAFLALEWIESGPPAADHDEQLGRGLAQLHRTAAPRFGLERDNFIATLPQSNTPSATWSDFYRCRRLEPQVRMAVDAGRVRQGFARRFEELWPRLPELTGPAEPPAPLHGDLWGGNAMRDEGGAPVLIDPAAYAGHREVDLAMMRLFGGFSDRCFSAYAEAYPLSDGHRHRVGLYQLYPLLVHVNLFGGGYADQVERILDRLL